MTVFIIILVIVVIVIIKFFIDRDKMLLKQVDNVGGMKEKYKYMISELSQSATPQFCEVTRDHLYFRFPGNTTLNYYFTEHFNTLEIIWILQISGKRVKELKWMFPQSMPHDEMLDKMGDDLQKVMDDLFNKTIIEHNVQLDAEFEDTLEIINSKRPELELNPYSIRIYEGREFTVAQWRSAGWSDAQIKELTTAK